MKIPDLDSNQGAISSRRHDDLPDEVSRSGLNGR